MPQHLVVTGPIAGHIATPDSRIPADSVDCTPDVIVCDTEEIGHALTEAIDAHHRAQGTHPDQGGQYVAEQPQREATYATLGA